VDGEAVATALPRAGGLRLLSAAREPAGRVPGESLAAVVDGLRAAGRPVVLDLPRTAEGADAVLAEADLAVLLVPARLRAACAARVLLASGGPGASSPWAAAHLVVRRQPGGLAVPEVARLVGRPVLAVLGHDAAAGARAERGQPPPTGGRSAWGAVTRRLLAELEPADEAVPA
jgi:hypothetical protein